MGTPGWWIAWSSSINSLPRSTTVEKSTNSEHGPAKRVCVHIARAARLLRIMYFIYTVTPGYSRTMCGRVNMLADELPAEVPAS